MERNGASLPTQRRILGDFPNIQQRPVVIEGQQIQTIKSIPKPRWNFQKADWISFTKNIDDSIRWIPPCSGNYSRFSKIVINSAKKTIPLGFRKEYIPGWNQECETLYTSLKHSGNCDDAKKTLEALDKQRRDRWIKMVENTDFKHSSPRAWRLLCRLGSDGSSKSNLPKINPNLIANRIIEMSRAPSHKQFTMNIKKKFSNLKKVAVRRDTISAPFSLDEINMAISKFKTGKSAGFDKIFLEFYALDHVLELG